MSLGKKGFICHPPLYREITTEETNNQETLYSLRIVQEIVVISLLILWLTSDLLRGFPERGGGGGVQI